MDFIYRKREAFAKEIRDSKRTKILKERRMLRESFSVKNSSLFDIHEGFGDIYVPIEDKVKLAFELICEYTEKDVYS